MSINQDTVKKIINTDYKYHGFTFFGLMTHSVNNEYSQDEFRQCIYDLMESGYIVNGVELPLGNRYITKFEAQARDLIIRNLKLDKVRSLDIVEIEESLKKCVLGKKLIKIARIMIDRKLLRTEHLTS